MITTRRPNTTTRGGGFDATTIRAVWNKAQAVYGVDPNVRRKDSCGAWIDCAAYGQTAQNGYGWLYRPHPLERRRQARAGMAADRKRTGLVQAPLHRRRIPAGGRAAPYARARLRRRKPAYSPDHALGQQPKWQIPGLLFAARHGGLLSGALAAEAQGVSGCVIAPCQLADFPAEFSWRGLTILRCHKFTQIANFML